MDGCWNKWRGPRGAHEAGGMAQGGGRTMCPRGQMVGPPGVFYVPENLKYSTKNHTSFSGHLENFYFWGIFYCMDNVGFGVPAAPLDSDTGVRAGI